MKRRIMSDKLEDFLLKNQLDIYKPNEGHEYRFERLLNENQNKKKSINWSWLSVAASVILIVGFWLGTLNQNQITQLADVSPEMKEVENYFISTINEELSNIESQRSLETETIIEEALDQLESLEEDYLSFVQDLKKNINRTKVINAMIKNYQQRLQVLENLLEQIEITKNPKLILDEVII